MKVWPVKHSPLLRQPERFIARSELQALIRNVTQNLVNIKDESGQFLLRLDDGRVIDTKGWAGWEWTHGVGLYGIYQYYQQTGDIEMRDIIDRWFADRFAEGATTKNVNTMAPFLTLAYRFEETGRMAYLPWLESWAEWAMHEMPRTEQGGMQHMTLAEENHQQMWDDTLMMTVLPLAKIGKLLNRPQYVEEATYQFLLHVQNLMDRETGLWFHGWNYEGRHNFARARWARGNSWLTMVIPDFLELVDLPEGKNLVGTFTQPHLVLCDTQALDTLSPAVLAEGWAEIIKYGMIRSRELLDFLREKPAGENLDWVIAQCLTIKRDVVAADERDNAVRQVLNFGHTIGHAIERCGHYAIYHGEGVAMGMAIMTRACVKQGRCPAECWTVLEELLDKYHLPKTCDMDPADLLAAARADKKRRGNAITLIQPERLGNCVLYKTDYDELARVLEVGMAL